MPPVPVRFGVQLWPQQTTWPEFRDISLAAEAAGWDGIWAWDHLMAIQGPWEQPIFEGWGLVHAIGALTSRARIGLMVGANTFRNPGLTAKLATTLDHVTNGRSVLGIGGAWFEREHEAFGIDFGASVGERLDRLEEAVPLLRRLLDGERVTHSGRFYTMRDALCEPRPIQARLPILVGGSGPQKTMRTVARHADGWNTGNATPEMAAERLDHLRALCDEAGRDIAEIELTIGFPMIIRQTVEEARAVRRSHLAYNGVTKPEEVPSLMGSPATIAETFRPYLDLGFRSVVIRMGAPFDRETIDRLPEVLALLDG